MFGKNEISKVDRGTGATLVVQEVFRTIQGEGPSSGTPATFIRLFGCNLACWFCDTDFESNPEVRTLDAIIDKCAGGPKLIVLTGGEPLRQNISPLIQRLVRAGYRVEIETAGGLPFVTDPDARITVVVSPKTPTVHEKLDVYADYYKYVISGSRAFAAVDGLPIVNYQDVNGTPRILARPKWLATHPERVFVQPMDEQDRSLNAANTQRCIELALNYGYRISLQTHKILGVP